MKLETITSKFKEMFSSMKTNKVSYIDIDRINVDKEFENIFIQKEADVEKLKESMSQNGYDPNFPVILAKGCPEVDDETIVEGHSRLKAARQLNIRRIPYVEKQFSSREEIISFIYRIQVSRRNLSEQEQLLYIQKMTAMKKENGKQLKTDQQIADELDISRRQLAKLKELQRKSDSATLESFMAGQISLNAAYNKMKSEEVSEVTENASPSVKESIVPKTSKKTYHDGYTAGIRYALDSLANGKTSADLLAELDA